MHLIVVPQQSSGWWHNYSNQNKAAGLANEQFVLSYVYGFYASNQFTNVTREKRLRGPKRFITILEKKSLQKEYFLFSEIDKEDNGTGNAENSLLKKESIEHFFLFTAHDKVQG